MNASPPQPRPTTFDRQSSRSSSEYTDDSFQFSGLRRTRSFESGYQTTPSSSYRDSPTNSYFPKTAFPSSSRGSPTSGSLPQHETWRNGSDLPESSRSSHPTGSPYAKPPTPYPHASRASLPRRRASSIPKPPPPPHAAGATVYTQRHTPYYVHDQVPQSSALPRYGVSLSYSS